MHPQHFPGCACFFVSSYNIRRPSDALTFNFKQKCMVTRCLTSLLDPMRASVQNALEPITCSSSSSSSVACLNNFGASTLSNIPAFAPSSSATSTRGEGSSSAETIGFWLASKHKSFYKIFISKLSLFSHQIEPVLH